MRASPVLKELVLLGGGHSHLAVLEAFGARPLPGVHLTLVSRASQTPYSGMLPGLISGYYTHDEAHIDLTPLCRFAGAHFLCDEVVGLDPRRRLVHLRDGPDVAFDMVSINTGSTPAIPPGIAGQCHVIPVKPVDALLQAWKRVRQRAADRPEPLRMAVVGGGAGGVELALALSARLAKDGHPARVQLLTADSVLLPTHNRSTRSKLKQALARAGIGLRTGARAAFADSRPATNASIATRLVLETGESIDFDEVFWATQAAAPSWLEGSGLTLDDAGFVLVDETLRSVSDPQVFAAGDVAAIDGRSVPKSGVVAVREGRPLQRNLRRSLLGQQPVRYQPQRSFLNLIGTGENNAVASRGNWSLEGRVVWHWKEWIDRRFMRRYQR